MAKNKRTGPGKGEQRLHPPSILLFNFDVDGSFLKLEHHVWLRMFVEPKLRREGSVTIVGLASRTGRWRHNLRLSQARADHTLDYLRKQVRNDFNVRSVVGYGEGAASQEGYEDEIEDERFRSVVLFTSDNPNPPAPPPTVKLDPTIRPEVAPGFDWGDNISKGFDIAGWVTTLAEYAPKIGEAAGALGYWLGVVGGIAQMPLLWWSVRNQNLTNGSLEGFWGALGDMAKQYSDDALDSRPLSLWPAVTAPHPHPMKGATGSVDQKEWMEGKRAGAKAAYEMIRATEGVKMKDGIFGGRQYLRALYKSYGDGTADAIHRFLEDKVIFPNAGQAWPISK